MKERERRSNKNRERKKEAEAECKNKIKCKWKSRQADKTAQDTDKTLKHKFKGKAKQNERKQYNLKKQPWPDCFSHVFFTRATSRTAGNYHTRALKHNFENTTEARTKIIRHTAHQHWL